MRVLLPRITTVIALVSLFFAASTAYAVDYDEYRRLKDRATVLLQTVEDASAETVAGLRPAAAEADLALLDWLDEFLQSEEFASLVDDQKAAVYSDRYRWEYNLCVQLIAMNRCDEASTRVGSLLATAWTDEELRPLLTQTYQEAVQCAAAPVEVEMTSVTVESGTSGAQISLDGVPMGTGPLTVDLRAGDHTVEVSAEGFVTQTVNFTAAGERQRVGPIFLQQDVPSEPPPSASNPPEWYEWTLWGVGVAGIGSFVGLYVTASGRQDTLDSVEPGFEVIDPAGEQDTIDSLNTMAFVTGGIGVAAAITGTVLYLMSEPDEQPRRGASVGFSYDRVTFDWRF